MRANPVGGLSSSPVHLHLLGSTQKRCAYPPDPSYENFANRFPPHLPCHPRPLDPPRPLAAENSTFHSPPRPSPPAAPATVWICPSPSVCPFATRQKLALDRLCAPPPPLLFPPSTTRCPPPSDDEAHQKGRCYGEVRCRTSNAPCSTGDGRGAGLRRENSTAHSTMW